MFNYLIYITKINYFPVGQMCLNFLIGSVENGCLPGVSLFLDTPDKGVWQTVVSQQKVGSHFGSSGSLSGLKTNFYVKKDSDPQT